MALQSPSNDKGAKVPAAEELRVLIATDVLSEGQNLQDCAIVVNFDLPWAIIRLIQRAGRVDRIGQQAARIVCYSFLPADGVERIIRVRNRVRQRLTENAEVVGSDEAFFEGDDATTAILDLYNERAGVLDGDDDSEIDLVSYAYQIWKDAIDRDPALQKIVPDLPPVVYSTQPHTPSPGRPEGVLVYMRSPADNDALVWMDSEGKAVTNLNWRYSRPLPAAPTRLRFRAFRSIMKSSSVLWNWRRTKRGRWWIAWPPNRSPLSHL